MSKYGIEPTPPPKISHGGPIEKYTHDDCF